jgi:nicotinate-nucleotide adenylyltransferase
VAQEAAEQLSLDRLLFLVAKRPPHKLDEVLSPAELRLEMARAAVAGSPLLDVSDVELEREGPSYTVDTLRHMRGAHPDSELFFLMGADQLAEFHEWQEPAEIAELATVVAVSRDGTDMKKFPRVDLGSGILLEFQTIPVTRVDISSTEVRNRVREGRSIQHLVPEEVSRIIEKHRLYRSIS